jgi:hypothetical protein
LQAGFLLQILSGERFYDYKTRVSTRTGKKGQGWGIDASALGAMSAGQIILQSTDKGVGVRVKSKMAASAGDVMISADGRIRLKGSIRSIGSTPKMIPLVPSQMWFCKSTREMLILNFGGLCRGGDRRQGGKDDGCKCQLAKDQLYFCFHNNFSFLMCFVPFSIQPLGRLPGFNSVQRDSAFKSFRNSRNFFG